MTLIISIFKSAGWARIIIFFFLLILFIVAPFVGIRIDTSLSDTINRFAMNGVLVLSLIPMIRSGTGLNFGVPIGIIAGILGAVCSIESGVAGFPGFLIAILVSLPIGALFGYLYGLLLNKVKGGEMVIALYVGWSFVFLMCIMWLILPFKSQDMIWAYGGSGLRTTISVERYWIHILNDFLQIRITEHLVIPTGMILFFGFMCFLVWGFFKTKTGTAMAAVGANPEYAKSSGVDTEKMRVYSVMLSTVIAAIGILVYHQCFGFVQLYLAPWYLVFPTVAAILLGGGSVNKATIFNVIIGVFLFQGLLTMTPSVINNIIKTDMSETVRMIVSNGMILYALTRKFRG